MNIKYIHEQMVHFIDSNMAFSIVRRHPCVQLPRNCEDSLCSSVGNLDKYVKWDLSRTNNASKTAPTETEVAVFSQLF